MKTLVASLIILASFSGIAKGESSSETILLGEKTTVNSINSNADINSQELACQMESWINNSAFWNADVDSEEQELALQMKSWINDSACWSGDADNSEQELALQMKSWMNNSAYWNGSEDAMPTATNLQAIK